MARRKKKPNVLMIEGDAPERAIILALENLESTNKQLKSAIRRNNEELNRTRRLLGDL